jgi:hypothetical protein
MPIRHALAAAALLGSIASPAATAALFLHAAAPAPAPLTEAEREAVLRDFAQLLRARYVDPAIAQRYAAAVEAAAAKGDYRGITDPEAFAARLTADLAAVSPDKHLRVTFGDMPARGRGTTRQSAQPDLEARWAAPGVAYLAVNASPGDPAVAAEAERLLLAHAGARALVIDLRRNRGGAATVMNSLIPLLYGKPTTLVRMDTRAAVEAELGRPDEEPFMREVAAPPGIVRREHLALPHRSEKHFFDVPVYILTSAKTASVAEHMTLALKRTKRATVIGETTSGAGNYGSFNRLGSRFVAFVPFGRTFDPDTGRGWEGTGIKPDIEAAADQALEVAIKTAADRAREGDPRTAS